MCCTVLAILLDVSIAIQLSRRGGMQADRLRHLTKYFATMLELGAVAADQHAADVHSQSQLTLNQTQGA